LNTLTPTHTHMQVRQAVAHDLPRLSELFAQLGYPVATAQLARRWVARLADGQTKAYVALAAPEVPSTRGAANAAHAQAHPHAHRQSHTAHGSARPGDSSAVIGLLVMHLVEPLHEDGLWGLISALVVDETVRGSGAGALLMAQAERDALAAGCSHIELSSSESRSRAHEFYHRQGYHEVRQRLVKTLAR